MFSYIKKQCFKCKKPLIPDYDTKKYGTKEWDKCTYKWSCKCNNKELRVFLWPGDYSNIK